MHRRFLLVLYLSISTCLLFSITACGGGTANNEGGGNPPPPVVAVSISPTSATISADGTQQFHATVTGSSNTAVQWEVNNVAGGSSQTGTISNAGLYTAPSTTTTLQVTVTAVAEAD